MAPPATRTKQGSSGRGVTLLAEALLSLTAIYTLWILASKNGLFDSINAFTQQDSPVFPGPNEPLITKHTGITAVDKQLTVLVLFFESVVAGSSDAFNLFNLFGLGQFGGLWALLFMESLRAGNQGRAVSFIGTYGFFVQNVAFAISTPIYLIIHLLTSPVSKLVSSTNSNSVLFVSRRDLVILPFSVTLGYIIPSVLMISRPGATLMSALHQRYIVFWQAFPLWTIIAQFALKQLSILFLGQDASTKSKEHLPTTSTAYLRSAKRVYTSILVFCVATHIPAVILAIVPAHVIPDSMPVLRQLAQPTFASVFVPPLPILGPQVQNMTEGALIFLQWDMYIGGLASLLWGMFLYRNASAKGGQPGSTMLLKVAVWSLLTGPAGALAVLLWERDEMLSHKIKQ